MALKNINIFEQHVEKIVLAVAGAGALFMMYLAVQPITLPEHQEVTPKKVEDAIATEINNLERHRQDLDNAGAPQPVIPDFVKIYRDIAGGQPLSKDILETKIADIGPHNLQPSIIERPPEETVKSVIPAPPAPEFVHAEALQLPVANPQLDPQTGQLAPLQPGTQLVVTTRNVVAIDGYIAVGKMLLDLVKETNETKRFTADVQKGLVYRVVVQRSEKLPNGGWSKAEVITPAKGFAHPTDILTTTMEDGGLPLRLPDIDAQFLSIQLPNYYVDNLNQPVLPPILTRPIPKAIADLTTQLHNDIQSAQAGGTVRFTPPPTPIATPGGVPAAAPMFPTTADQLKLLEVQPFTFWDDSVQPDHTYKYRVQVQFVNPGFGWKWGLADPTKRIVPTLATGTGKDGYVDIQPEIVVHSDMAFFIQGTDLTGRISGQIFKQKDGRWYMGLFTVEKGVNISGQISTGMGQPALDVDTKFALVDYSEAGRNVHVILKDPTGNLITRDTTDDWKKQERTDLEDKVKKAAAAAATAPAIDPLTGQPMVTPTVSPVPMVTPTTGRAPIVTPPATRPNPGRGPLVNPK